MLTCYDAAFARLLDRAEVDVLLVGDSLNQVIAGQETTLSATLDQMIYHAAAVRRGAPGTLLFVDLPFLTYQVSVSEAIRNAGRVLQETEAERREAGGRAAHGGDRARAGRAGHPGDGPPRAHAPVRARTGRLQGAGTGGGCRRPAAGGRTGARGGRRLRHRAGAGAGRSSRGGCRRRSRFPPSGSAPAPTAMARCWCCTTCWDSTKGSLPSFLSRFAELGARSVTRSQATPTKCGQAAIRARSTASNEGDRPAPPRAWWSSRPHPTSRAGCARVGAKGVASVWCPRWATCTKATSPWWTRRAAGRMSC